MAYYILKDKEPIKVSPKKFIEWNNAFDERKKVVSRFRSKNTSIITKFYGYKQIARTKTSVFETQLIIDEKPVKILAQSKKRAAILAQHRKYVAKLKECDNSKMDFLATIEGY